jgi:hypothetical protein
LRRARCTVEERPLLSPSLFSILRLDGTNSSAINTRAAAGVFSTSKKQCRRLGTVRGSLVSCKPLGDCSCRSCGFAWQSRVQSDGLRLGGFGGLFLLDFLGHVVRINAGR